MNHYKFSALISLRSRDNVQAKCTELVVIRVHVRPTLGIQCFSHFLNDWDRP